MMTLYDTKWNSDVKDSMIPKVEDLQKKILNNLHTLLEEQEDPPVLTEVTLLAWGTKEQHIHCDYAKTSFNKATKETEIFDLPPALPNKCYGTVIYHFRNDEHDLGVYPRLMREYSYSHLEKKKSEKTQKRIRDRDTVYIPGEAHAPLVLLLSILSLEIEACGVSMQF